MHPSSLQQRHKMANEIVEVRKEGVAHAIILRERRGGHERCQPPGERLVQTAAALAQRLRRRLFPLVQSGRLELERRIRSAHRTCERDEWALEVGVRPLTDAPALAQSLAIGPRLREHALRELGTAPLESRACTARGAPFTEASVAFIMKQSA